MCYFHTVFCFVFVCNVFWVESQRYCGGGGGVGGGGGGCFCWVVAEGGREE